MLQEPTEPTLTITKSELQALIAVGVAAHGTATSDPTSALTLDQRVALQAQKERPRGEPPEYIPCISRVEYGGTGATWLAVVIKERMGQDDLGRVRIVPTRVVALHHYRRPAGWMSMFEGDALKVIRDNGGQLTTALRAEATQRYDAPDRQANVGKPINPAYRATPEEAAELGIPTEPEVGTHSCGSVG